MEPPEWFVKIQDTLNEKKAVGRQGLKALKVADAMQNVWRECVRTVIHDFLIVIFLILRVHIHDFLIVKMRKTSSGRAG